MCSRTLFITLALTVLFLNPSRLLVAQSDKVSSSNKSKGNFSKNFIDSTDNALDVSGYLNSAVGLFPIPLIITEPALGFGGGLGIAYLHNKKKRPGETKPGQLPPVISMVAGAYTSNETWIAIAGHQGSYLKDFIRYTGAVGFMSVNLTYFDETILSGQREYRFNNRGFLTFHELLFRFIKKLPLFAGANYIYMNNEVTFDTAIPIPGLEDLTRNTGFAGINGVFVWDSRNNSFTPTQGIMSAFEIGAYDKALGGTSNYNHFSNRTYGYLPLMKDKVFGGLRLNYESKVGVVPFNELPFVNMRGIQMLRYQDHHVGVIETEVRWNFLRRWSIVGFGGAGFTAPSADQFDFSDPKISAGGGFRYFLSKSFGIHAGIDIARGPEIWAWYLTLGSSWFR